jgi:hypothetical protein
MDGGSVSKENPQIIKAQLAISDWCRWIQLFNRAFPTFLFGILFTAFSMASAKAPSAPRAVVAKAGMTSQEGPRYAPGELGLISPPPPLLIKLFDTKVKEPLYGNVYNFQDTLSWQNKANWVQVQDGVTNYTFIGNTVIETDTYYYLFHTANQDGPFIYPKYQNGDILPSGSRYGSEIYGYRQTPTQLENMHLNSIRILQNTTLEIILRVDAGGFQTKVVPDQNIIDYTFKNSYVSASPGNNDMYGIDLHSGSNAFGVGVADDEAGNDFLASPYFDSFVTNPLGRTSPPDIDTITCPVRFYPYESIYHGCDGTKLTVPLNSDKFLLQLSKVEEGNSNYNIMYMITNKDSSITPSSIKVSYHRPQGSGRWYSVEVIGPGDIKKSQSNSSVAYTVLPYANSFYAISPNTGVSLGSIYTVSSWIPTIPGKYRMTGKFEKSFGIFEYKTVTVENNNFALSSPTAGTLRSVVIYLYDRTASTPTDILTPMDVYRQSTATSTLSITAQPANIIVTAPATATFSVVASGAAPLSYQWQKNGSAIPGATSASYTTPATTAVDNGTSFTVTVTNSTGSVTSSAAVLTVTGATSGNNLISNPGFESGTTPWLFYTGGTGAFTAASPGNTGTKAANVALTSGSTNIQLYQLNVPLEPNTPYRLSFAGYSTTGDDVTVRLIKNASPYTSYAPDFTANLGTSWQTFTTEFTSSGFTGTVNDGRLMFWFAPFAAAGDTYYLDDVRLEKVTETAISPNIITHPENKTVIEPATATFSVLASGTAPLSYQWKKGGVDISGATSASYTTPPTTTADSGASFTVTVGNLAGSVTSNPATLTVNTLPSIITHPENKTVTAPATATFSVLASGTAPLSYQWKKGGVDISGATSASYTTPATTVADNGSIFTVTVTNSAGSATSSAAVLTVNAAAGTPSIMSHPGSLTVAAGETACFFVSASGTAPLSYQWKKGGVAISGATYGTYCMFATTAADNGSIFTVTVTNSAGSVSSSAAILTVNVGGGGNILGNPGFEGGTASWSFYAGNSSGSWTAIGPAYEGSNAAKVSFSNTDTNQQLYLYNLSLQPNTQYRLRFAAYSSSGRDLRVELLKHVSPYTAYGLNQVVDLSTGWQVFDIPFTTGGFSNPISDARFRFVFNGYAAAGDVYWIDAVSITSL